MPLRFLPLKPEVSTMKYLLLLLILSIAVSPINAQRRSRGSGRTDVHVSGHLTKKGTYVQPYDRAAPGMGSHSSSSSFEGHRSNTHSRSSVSTGTIHSDSHRGSKRSEAAKESFERQYPCPATGKHSGSCPGYVVDHVRPLACGGADSPSNMQWQTVADAKAKDKTERIGCR
jgi:hypothetical protein